MMHDKLEPLALTPTETVSTTLEVDDSFSMVCSLIEAMKARRDGQTPMHQAATSAIHAAVLRAVLDVMPTTFDRPGVQELYNNTYQVLRKKLHTET